MQYLLLIYSDESIQKNMSPEEHDAYIGSYGTFTQGIVETGEFSAGQALTYTSEACSVRVREGQAITTDGPFAETREALGGFYLVEAESMERAAEIAAQIPTARHGTIEVRPIKNYGT